jgi:dihydrofolate reductase
MKLIAACDNQYGIGKNNTLPWRISEDLKHFHDVTVDSPNGHPNIVIMGRKTYESIPEARRPFKDRVNIVISKTAKAGDFGLFENLRICNSIEDAIQMTEQIMDKGDVFCIGGATIYNQFIERGLIDQIILTKVDGNFQCDTFLSQELIESNFQEISSHTTVLNNRQDDINYNVRFLTMDVKK